MTDSHLYKKKIISVIRIYLSGYALRTFELIFDLTSIMNFFKRIKQHYYGSKKQSFNIPKQCPSANKVYTSFTAKAQACTNFLDSPDQKSGFGFAERNAKSVLRSKIRSWIHRKEHTLKKPGQTTKQRHLLKRFATQRNT